MRKQKTQNELILEYMQKHGSITPREAYTDECDNCMRLSGRIYDLRKMGYDIEMRPKKYTSRSGKKKSYAEYFLKGDVACLS